MSRLFPVQGRQKGKSHCKQVGVGGGGAYAFLGRGNNFVLKL